MIEELIKDAIVSTQPAMMVNLRACSAPAGLVSKHPKSKVLHAPASPGDSVKIPPPAPRCPVRSHPRCPRPSQSFPDLPGYCCGSFEQLTWEVSWEVSMCRPQPVAASIPVLLSRTLPLICSSFLTLRFSNCWFLPGSEELCCVAELDSPMQQKWTKPVRAGPEVEWTEDLAL